MATIFDAPMPPIGLKNPFWIGLLWCSAGNAIGNLLGIFAAFLGYGFPFNGKRLPDVGKVQIAIEFGRDPDLSDFDSPMLAIAVINVIRLHPVFEVKRDVLENAGLILLHGQMVMPMFRDDVFPDLLLGQQGVRGDVLSFDIDGFQKRNRRFDFVGLFDFIAVFYRQGAHFFWVWQAFV